MGLDMYLKKSTYVENWPHTPLEEKFNITIMRGGFPYEKIDPEKISYITEQVAYWRKFNALHKWFVDNVQEGEDDCKEYHVSNEDLQNLLKTLEQIAENPEKASELLPTQGGFFFGGLEYDEDYMDNVRYTIDVIKKLLEEKSGNIYYTSSW